MKRSYCKVSRVSILFKLDGIKALYREVEDSEERSIGSFTETRKLKIRYCDLYSLKLCTQRDRSPTLVGLDLVWFYFYFIFNSFCAKHLKLYTQRDRSPSLGFIWTWFEFSFSSFPIDFALNAIPFGVETVGWLWKRSESGLVWQDNLYLTFIFM